jgi:hypothetical protein
MTTYEDNYHIYGYFDGTHFIPYYDNPPRLNAIYEKATEKYYRIFK